MDIRSEEVSIRTAIILWGRHRPSDRNSAPNVRTFRGRTLYVIGCVCLTAVMSRTALPLAQRIDPPSDLQGIWNNGTVTPLERPAQFKDKPYLSPDEATEYSRTYWERERETRGDQYRELQADANTTWNEPLPLDRRRTALIVVPANGRLPALVSGAKERALARAKKSYDDPEGADLGDRCLLATRADFSQASPPIIPGPAFATYYQIVQTNDYVMIVAEWFHDARFIRLHGDHPPASVRKWLGDSIGHWEGKTLVVDTTNFRSDIQAINSSEQLHVLERFTRIDANTILYHATVTDPGTWVTPWTAELTFRATTDRMFEFACHEGNYAIENYMRGARFEERAKPKAPERRNK
jgi:hypothetical protein